MALPTIQINNGAGSDTAASGAGPATAVTGTAAAHTGGIASTTITLTNTPDLSGVATDGSHVLWMKTASGRQFSKITAKDDGADTVTVEDSFTIASGSAVDYAIGGKRKAMNNADTATIFLSTGAKPGWTIDIQDNAPTLTATISVTCAGDLTTGHIVIKSTTGTRPVITSATNSVALFSLNAANYVRFQHLNLTHTAATRGVGILGVTGASSDVEISDCVFSGCLSAISDYGSATNANWRIFGNEITGCTSHGINAAIMQYGYIFGNDIHDNAGSGIFLSTAAMQPIFIEDNILDTNDYGLRDSGTARTRTFLFNRNIVVDNVTQGFYSAETTGSNQLLMKNNIFYGNGGYQINLADAQAENDARAIFVDYNAFGSPTSGNYLNLTAGAHDITLTADPFVSRAGRNFTLNATAGGGAALKAVGYPTALGGQANYRDAGPYQHADPVIVTPAAGKIYSGQQVTSDGTALVTGTLHASNMFSVGGVGSDDLVAGDLRSGKIVDNVTGTMVAVAGGAPVLGGHVVRRT